MDHARCGITRVKLIRPPEMSWGSCKKSRQATRLVGYWTTSGGKSFRAGTNGRGWSGPFNNYVNRAASRGKENEKERGDNGRRKGGDKGWLAGPSN